MLLLPVRSDSPSHDDRQERAREIHFLSLPMDCRFLHPKRCHSNGQVPQWVQKVSTSPIFLSEGGLPMINNGHLQRGKKVTPRRYLGGLQITIRLTVGVLAQKKRN